MKISLYRFAVIGGDMRQVHLAELLTQKNVRVSVYGLCTEIRENHHTVRLHKASSLEVAVQCADHVILPTPLFKQEHLWGAPCMQNHSIQELLLAMQPGTNLYAGCIPSSVKKCAAKLRIGYHDYMEDNTFSWQNTIAAAEGMLAEAFTRSPRNLTNSNCVVLGYGKCGSTLVSYLRAFTPNISVFEQDASLSARSGLYGKRLTAKQLPEVLREAHFIFNTIPSLILTEKLLQQVSGSALLLDLASAPGGIDYEAAQKLSLQAVLLPGLPGKYAPYSSAQIMLDYLEQLTQ